MIPPARSTDASKFIIIVPSFDVVGSQRPQSELEAVDIVNARLRALRRRSTCASSPPNTAPATTPFSTPARTSQPRNFNGTKPCSCNARMFLDTTRNGTG